MVHLHNHILNYLNSISDTIKGCTIALFAILVLLSFSKFVIFCLGIAFCVGLQLVGVWSLAKIKRYLDL